MSAVEEQNVALRSQVQELVEQKLWRDNQLDNFSEALDSRVEEWKVGLKFWSTDWEQNVTQLQEILFPVSEEYNLQMH